MAKAYTAAMYCKAPGPDGVIIQYHRLLHPSYPPILPHSTEISLKRPALSSRQSRDNTIRTLNLKRGSSWRSSISLIYINSEHLWPGWMRLHNINLGLYRHSFSYTFLDKLYLPIHPYPLRLPSRLMVHCKFLFAYKMVPNRSVPYSLWSSLGAMPLKVQAEL